MEGGRDGGRGGGKGRGRTVHKGRGMETRANHLN